MTNIIKFRNIINENEITPTDYLNYSKHYEKIPTINIKHNKNLEDSTKISPIKNINEIPSRKLSIKSISSIKPSNNNSISKAFQHTQNKNTLFIHRFFYKGYKLNEYKEVKKLFDFRNGLGGGGLGPCKKDDIYMNKIEKIKKKNQYSLRVKLFNSLNIIKSLEKNKKEN